MVLNRTRKKKNRVPGSDPNILYRKRLKIIIITNDQLGGIGKRLNTAREWKLMACNEKLKRSHELSIK